MKESWDISRASKQVKRLSLQFTVEYKVSCGCGKHLNGHVQGDNSVGVTSMWKYDNTTG